MSERNGPDTPKPVNKSIHPSVCKAQRATAATPTARGLTNSSAGDVDGLQIMLSDRHRTRGHCGTGTRHGRHPLVFPLAGQQ